MRRTFQRDPNLLEVESQLLSKWITGVDIQRTAEMSHPIHLDHSIQCDFVFECRVRDIVETDLWDWVKGTEVVIFDSV
jgi:hypothetical protein